MSNFSVISTKAEISGREGAGSEAVHNLAKIPAFAGMTL